MTGKDSTRSEAILREALSTLTYLAVVAAVSYAIAKRDTVTRLWMRAKTLGKRRDPYAAEIAAFRRDIADMSRGTAGPDTTRPPGLYERPDSA